MERPYLRQFAASDDGRAGLVAELDDLRVRIADLEQTVAELVGLLGGPGWHRVGESFSDGTWFEDPDGRRFGWVPAAGADPAAEEQAEGTA